MSVFPEFRLDSQMRDITRGMAGTLALRIMGAGVGLFSSVLLARYLGAHNLGILAYALAWAGVLVIFGSLGFNQLLVREIAIHSGRQEWPRIRGLLGFTFYSGLGASVLLVPVGLLAVYLFSDNAADNGFLGTFTIAVAGTPFLILTQFRQSAMRGFRKVVLGQVPESTVLPVIFLGLLTAGYFLLDRQLTAQHAVSFRLISLVAAFLVGAHLLRRTIPAPVNDAEPSYNRPVWSRMAIPLFLIAVIQFLNHNVDMLMLGYLAPAEQVGYFAVVKSLTEIIVFVLIAAEMIVAPRIAQLYATGELEQLQYIVRKAAQLIAVVSVPVAVAIFVWGEWILSLYGAEFSPAYAALQFLCLGQMLNVLCGPVGQLAIHTGHERATTYIVAAAALVNIVLNWILIPRFGATGAAAATAASLAVWNLGLLVYIMVKTGLSALAIPLPLRIQPSEE